MAGTASLQDGAPRRADMRCDLVEMDLARAAAAAPDVHMRKPACKRAHLAAEFRGIALLEMAELAQRDLLHLRGIRAESAQPLHPCLVGQGVRELLRVRAVERVAGGAAACLRVDPGD